ncbi:Sec63 Brl domain-containing protein [Russula brevipes]|nr:Sec63 Brl domain-containing protein [Russula brevipes]
MFGKYVDYRAPRSSMLNRYQYYEEVVVPPAKAMPPRSTERLIPVNGLDDLARKSFPDAIHYLSNCLWLQREHVAPTGAGKTDVAMLTILRVLASIALVPSQNRFPLLSEEMTSRSYTYREEIAKRLQWLAIRVRELTGDVQLTKAEIAETQIIVTTPEKWDVVTRKPSGEGEIASKLKLLIIDEVHLLNEERGAVIEAIVESSQSVIRIVGLSATLPNYIDVSDFLRSGKALVYHHEADWPVPLEQHFIGVKGKPGSAQSKMNLDLATFEKVSELVQEGHQVMEAAVKEDILTDFSCQDHPSYGHFRREISASRNKEMKRLFDDGFGIHHAGMLRADRNMMEKMFSARAIKVLCCTATLAWGVNLPAHAVIIKGTQVYDNSKGSFVDLSVLDVLQVFGRAGRPGFETSGQGFICTTGDKLQHYLDAVTSQNPIESKFIKGMIDAMNAEISLGTVATVHDAVRWLGYTYLFVRMQKTPLIYGMSYDDLRDDPSLNNKRHQLVLAAARSLVEARMIDHDRNNGSFTVTDLGRIAAKYYIHHKSIEIFNKIFGAHMTEEDVLAMVSLSTEFDQIQVRENETKELSSLLEQAPYEVNNAFDNSSGKVHISGESSRNKSEKPPEKPELLFTRQGKVNVLLQGYISWVPLEDFALVSDMQYVAQNAGRITRALLEIAISRKWAGTSAVLMAMSKAIEKRLWPSDHPLKQFSLKQDVFYGLEKFADAYSVSDLVRMSPDELGKLVHLNPIHGQAILTAAKQFPAVHVSYSLRPLGPDVLKIDARVRSDFSWSSKHGSVEPFWLWVEDHEEEMILQISYLLLRQSTDVLNVEFLISIPEGQIPPFVTIRYVSERWMGAEDEVRVSFDDLVMPSWSGGHTPRLNLPFLSLSVLKNNVLRELFAAKLRNLNAIQTQAFWSTVNTANNSLVCAPTGSGKSTLGHILVCETLTRLTKPGYILVIAPRHSIAMEWMSDLRGVMAAMGFSMGFVTGSAALAPARSKEIRLTTAAHLLAALSEGKDLAQSFPGLQLVVLENLEQLDPYYELPYPLCAASSKPADPYHVDTSAFHGFRPSDRDQSLKVAVHTFAIPHSAALFKAMARPASAAVLSVGPGPAIVFVPSRTQCSSVALDLIVNCTLETVVGVVAPPQPAGPRLGRFRFQGRRPVPLWAAQAGPRAVLELYAEGIVRVLVVAREACWALPVRAAAVVVMGTQYFAVHEDGAGRQLRNYTLEELVRMQGRAVRHGEAGHFHLFCQAEDKDTYMRFLEGGLPLESRLLGSEQLRWWYEHHRGRGHIGDKQEGAQALSWTFLARRAVSNPTYYDNNGTRDECLSRIVDELEGPVVDHGQDGPSASGAAATAGQL